MLCHYSVVFIELLHVQMVWSISQESNTVHDENLLHSWNVTILLQKLTSFKTSFGDDPTLTVGFYFKLYETHDWTRLCVWKTKAHSIGDCWIHNILAVLLHPIVDAYEQPESVLHLKLKRIVVYRLKRMIYNFHFWDENNGTII